MTISGDARQTGNPAQAKLATPGSASARMARQRSRDTAPEVELRRELFRRGLRYRIHRRPLASIRREADIVFPGPRIAVFVDGCFWHGCPEHRTFPKRNARFWNDKIEGNIARDRDTDERLTSHGWRIVRVWEHEAATLAADGIERLVRPG